MFVCVCLQVHCSTVMFHSQMQFGLVLFHSIHLTNWVSVLHQVHTWMCFTVFTWLIGLINWVSVLHQVHTWMCFTVECTLDYWVSVLLLGTSVHTELVRVNWVRNLIAVCVHVAWRTHTSQSWQLIFRGKFLKLSKIKAIWFYHYLIMGVRNMFGGGFLRVVRNVYTVGTDVCSTCLVPM